MPPQLFKNGHQKFEKFPYFFIYLGRNNIPPHKNLRIVKGGTNTTFTMINFIIAYSKYIIILFLFLLFKIFIFQPEILKIKAEQIKLGQSLKF